LLDSLLQEIRSISMAERLGDLHGWRSSDIRTAMGET